MKKKIYVVMIIGICVFAFFPNSQAMNIKNTEIEELQFLEKSYLNEQSENRFTVYYASALVQYTKVRLSPVLSFSKEINVYSIGTFYCFDDDLENLVLEIVMNYTVQMNFDTLFPAVLAPIVAFGLKIDNYTDYEWESFKLKHKGYAKYQGNISIEIQFDMDNITSGDKFLLDPTIAIVGDPLVYTSKDLQINKFTSFLMRLAYHIPLKNKYLLNKIILPFIAEHDFNGIHGESTKIGILFE